KCAWMLRWLRGLNSLERLMSSSGWGCAPQITSDLPVDCSRFARLSIAWMPLPSIADMYFNFSTITEPNFDGSDVVRSSFSVAPNKNGPRMRMTEQYAGMYLSVRTRGSPSPSVSSVTDATVVVEATL